LTREQAKAAGFAGEPPPPTADETLDAADKKGAPYIEAFIKKWELKVQGEPKTKPNGDIEWSLKCPFCGHTDKVSITLRKAGPIQFRCWHEPCKTNYKWKQLREKFEPAASRPQRKTKPVDWLLAMCGDFEYFKSTDAGAQGFIRFKNGDHLEVSTASGLKDELTNRYLEKMKLAPDKTSLASAIDTLVARCTKAPAVKIGVRIAHHGGAAYLDLCNKTWQVVEIRGEEWRVLDSAASPVLFRRPDGARALPVPVHGGSINSLRSLINVEKGNDIQWILAVSWLLGCFVPGGSLRSSHLRGWPGNREKYHSSGAEMYDRSIRNAE
jgi:hypothetical protein